MHTQIMTPLLRSTIGFDRFGRLFDAVGRMDEASLAYPPHNIEKTGENAYRISMAVAGFAENELEVNQRENMLVISGKSKNRDERPAFLHHGIARRNFERRFELADNIEVRGASLDHGLLHVDLVREIPESQRPRNIAINAEASPAGPEAQVAA